MNVCAYPEVSPTASMIILYSGEHRGAERMHPDNAYSKVSVNRTTVLQSTIPTICGGQKQEQEEGVDEPGVRRIRIGPSIRISRQNPR